MAGDWIKMTVGLRNDPTVGKLARLTKLDRLAVIGRLWALWSWADAHAICGHVRNASDEDIDELCERKGFAAALVEVGWLECVDAGVNIPCHEKHNGESAKERAMKNARQSKWRQTRGANVDAGPSTPPSTPPPTEPTTPPSTDASRDRLPEKRREEVIPPNPPKTGGKPVGLKAWIEGIRAAGERAVAADDPVFAYADRVGLRHDFVVLAWSAFKHRYLVQHPAKRYRDWRRVFRNSVEGNWLRLWYADPAGGYALTTVGIQAQRAQQEAA